MKLQLTPNTEILHLDGTLKFKNATFDGFQKVYNLSEIRNTKTFTANGFIVHNVGQEIKP